MKFNSCIAKISLLAFGATVYAATSSTYYFKGFSTSGSISQWYSNDNSWGVNAPSGTGFVVMVTGEDWGTWSPVHTLPKKLNDVNPSHATWFSQTSSPASGAGYDAWYDLPFLSTILLLPLLNTLFIVTTSLLTLLRPLLIATPLTKS